MSSDLSVQQVQQMLENQSSLNNKIDSLADQRRKSDSKKITEWVVAVVALLSFGWGILGHFQDTMKALLDQQNKLFDVRLQSLEDKIAPFAEQGAKDARQDGRLNSLEGDVDVLMKAVISPRH